MKRYLTKSCGKRVQEYGSGVHMVGRINFIFIDSRPTYLLIYLGTFVHFLVYTFYFLYIKLVTVYFTYIVF